MLIQNKFGRKYGLLLFLFIFTISLAYASYDTHQISTPLEFSFTSNNATQCNLTTGNTPYGNLILNQEATKSGQTFNVTIDALNFSVVGDYCFNLICTDGLTFEGGNFCREVTITGTRVDGVGQISVGLIYFFLALGFGFAFSGWALLNNRSIFISYGGLFLIIVGGAFLMYDIHLANLYATTIAVNSGASNVTTGIFLLVLRFIKLSPYIIAGVVAFASIRLLKEAIKKRKGSDGWDNDNY
jgi:hypothetical protein